MNFSIRNAMNPRIRRTVLTLLAASVIGALGTATASAAPADSDAPSVAVRYGDLDLSSASGARELYHRLVLASQHVCPDFSSGDLSTQPIVKACRNQAIVNAARKIPSPQLAAMVAKSIKAS